MLGHPCGRYVVATALVLASACARDGARDGRHAHDDAPALAQQSGTVPCAIDQILVKRCHTCHGPEPLSAPFSLVTMADLTGPSFFDPAVTMAASMKTRINSDNRRQKMPPPAINTLTPEELVAFNGWLDQGAKAGPACGEVAPPVDAGPPASDAGAPAGDAGAPASDAGAVGADPLPNLGGSGGASTQAIFYDDPALRCYKLRAFAAVASKEQKYSVPTSPDLYVAFNFRAPWTGTQYLKSFRSQLDNAEAVQHLLLFRQLNGGNESVSPNALGLHPDGDLLYSWAPGGEDLWLDRDVGMEIPANALLQLEAHYDNRSGAPVLDASGVEVCVTPTKPAHLAGIAWTGSNAINGPSARGTCTHASRTSIHLFASQPRLRRKGAHVKVELLRAGGATEVVHDQPFRFDAQRSYLHAIDIQPGDRLATTCTYRAASLFGKSSSNELCYVYALHWPARALARNSLNTILHGPNTCID